MNRDPKLPRCPRHPDSRVWRDGSYATRRGVRRRYRCVPLGNARPHRFVATGADAPRGFSYTVREIAAALVEVGRGQRHPGPPLGDEHRAGLAALQQPGQQAGGAGLPHDHVDRAALAADAGAPVGQVEVVGVERQDLGRPGRGLVEHPPERPLAQRDVLAGEQLADLGAGQRAGPVGPRLAADEQPGWVRADPPLALPVGGRRAQGVQRDVPCGRGALAPLLAEPGGDALGADLVQRGLAAERGCQAAQDAAIRAVGAGLLGPAQRGQVRGDGQPGGVGPAWPLASR